MMCASALIGMPTLLHRRWSRTASVMVLPTGSARMSLISVGAVGGVGPVHGGPVGVSSAVGGRGPVASAAFACRQAKELYRVSHRIRHLSHG